VDNIQLLEHIHTQFCAVSGPIEEPVVKGSV